MVVRINFNTYESDEDRLLDKWAYMDTVDDLKSVNIIDNNGETLGTVRRTNEDDVKGDNYFLTIGEKQIMGHKEDTGWTLYDVTNNGFHLAPIDNNSARARNLKTVFFETRRALKSSGRKQRVTPTVSRSRV